MVDLTAFFRQIDFALDWVLVEAGKPLYTQDDVADCLYIGKCSFLGGIFEMKLINYES